MEHVEMLRPRAATIDEYSPFYYDHSPLSIREIDTPRITKSYTTSNLPSSLAASKKKLHQSLDTVDEYPPSTISCDPSLERSQYGSVLIIGRSGTGKSSLLKQLVQRLPKAKHLYLINVKADEREAYEKIHAGGPEKVRSVALSNLRAISGRSMVIVEDIISMKEKEQTSLREAVNYTAHHKKCKLFCVTHTVFKTGIYSLMPLFHYIVFTSSPANGPILRQTFAQFGLPKQESENIVLSIDEKTRTLKQSLGKKRDPRCIVYFFDCTHMVVGYTTDSFKREETTTLEPVDASKQSTTTEARSSLNKNPLLEAFFPNSGPARAILQFIRASKTAQAHLDNSTLTFTFPSRTPRNQAKTVSLVDYIATALTATKVPSPSDRLLHHFLSVRCHLPQSVIANRRLSKNR